MKDFDSLLDIWSGQSSEPSVDYKEVIANYKKSTHTFKTKIILELTLMCLATVFVSIVWYITSFDYLTTHLSFFIIELCCIFYITRQIKNLKYLKEDAILDKPELHIEFVKRFQKERYKQHTVHYFLYFTGISMALMFYFIEFFDYLDITLSIVILIFVAIWFIFTSVFWRNVYIRKEEKKFNDMITELERLKQQLLD